jgi:GT2 family glycosyltransferase
VKIIASVVLFKHNYNDIKATLDSLINDESIDKIVLVDNGNHCHWLSDFTIPKLEIITNSFNRGFGAGHNSVFSKYSGSADYFLICNPDISFPKGEISNLYNYCIESEIDFSIPKILYPDGTLQYACKLLPNPLQLFLRRFLKSSDRGNNDVYELRHADYSQPFFAPSFSGCCMFLSNKAVEFSGGFDERFFLYLEDVDLSRRLSSSDLNVAYCPVSQVYHEAQRRSYLNYKFLFYHIISTLKYFNKWGWCHDEIRESLNKKCLNQFH